MLFYLLHDKIITMKKVRNILLTILLLMPLNLNAYEIENIYSNYVVVYNLTDNEIIYEKNADERNPIASLTKIMTTLVAIESINDLNEKVTIETSMLESIPWEASIAGFKEGDTVTYKDLLYGAMLPSGADATSILAIKLFGSEENFVAKMNDKANELNLKNTHFENTSGLEEGYNEHYSSAKDVMNLLKYALENETFKEIFTAKSYTTTNNLTLKTTLDSYNKNLNYDLSYILGGKTGYEINAGYCLATLSNINDTEIITVTIKAPTEESYNLIDTNNIYLTLNENTIKYNLVEQDKSLIKLNTLYAKTDEVSLISKVDVTRLLEKPVDEKDIKLKYKGTNEIKYDTKKGTEVGKIEIYYKDKFIEEIPVFTQKSLEFSILAFIKTNILYILGSILLIIMFLIVLRKPKKRK